MIKSVTNTKIQDNFLVSLMTGLTMDVDADSKKGRFGWVEIKQVFLPVVYRGEERAKLISQRAVEKILISTFKEVPHAALLCAEVDAVQMTKAEVDVHNEINQKHLSRKLGMEMFTTKERMVRETDVHNLLAFLDFSEKRVANKGSVISSCEDKAGFLRINCEGDVSDMPYVNHAKEKHLPMIYFDGNTGPLQDVAIPIDGWEMAHLRLLFNVQGVREELANSSFAAQVAPLSSVLQYFPPSAIVEEFWPERDFLPRTTMSGGFGCWTKLTCFTWLPQLTPVKEWPGFFASPYVLHRANLLNFGHVDALNTKPSKDLTVDLLVTLPDLASCLGLDLELVGLLLVKLRVTLYSPNSRQASLLESKGKAAVMNPVPLVKVADVVKHKAEVEMALRGKRL